uniref:Uncharacterized protein n=1 Tax=Ciona intestinalis TaxID=7719 RepID=F6Y563_CIOIN
MADVLAEARITEQNSLSDESDDFETALQIWNRLVSKDQPLNVNSSNQNTGFPDNMSVKKNIADDDMDNSRSKERKKLVKIPVSRRRKAARRTAKQKEDFFIDDDSPPPLEREDSVVSVYSLRPKRKSKSSASKSNEEQISPLSTPSTFKISSMKRKSGSYLLDTPDIEDNDSSDKQASPPRHPVVGDSDTTTDCDEINEVDFVSVVKPTNHDETTTVTHDVAPPTSIVETRSNVTTLDEIFFASPKKSPRKPPPRKLLKRKSLCLETGVGKSHTKIRHSPESKSLWDDDSLWDRK